MKNTETSIQNPLKITNYKTREERLNYISKSSLKELFSPANTATFATIAMDCVLMFARWNTISSPDNWYFIFLIGLASAYVIDMPMLLAGQSIVEYRLGMKNKKSMLTDTILGIVPLAIFVTIYFAFTYVTRDMVFAVATSSNMTNNAAESAEALTAAAETNNPVIAVAAIFAGLLPLGTSLASLLLTLRTYNPLKVRKEKLETAKAMASAHLLAIRKGQAEAKYLRENNLLLSREKDLFNESIEEATAQEFRRQTAFKEALYEKCSSADEISHVSEEGTALISTYPYDNEGYKESLSVIEKAVPKPKLGILPLAEEDESNETTNIQFNN